MNVNGSEKRSGKVPSRLRSVWKRGLDVGKRVHSGDLGIFSMIWTFLQEGWLLGLLHCNRKNKIERKLFAGGVGAGP